MKATLSALLLGPAALSAAQQPDFKPPRLSFTAADFFASSGGDVNSLPEGAVGVADGTVAVAAAARSHTTTVYQAAGHGESPAEVEARSGPLLTLFPGRPPASHVVTSADGRRSFLARRGGECLPDGLPGHDGPADGASASLLARYDLLASSPATSPAAVELWKYCALYVTGGVYVDAGAVPLSALGDALPGVGDGACYAVASSSPDAGVSPGASGGDVALSSLLALPRGHAVASGMVRAIASSDPDALGADALLLPRALMALVEIERSGGEGDQCRWALLRQRCRGVLYPPPGGAGDGAGAGGRPTRLRSCPSPAGYCCEVLGPSDGRAFLLSGEPMVPAQVLPDGLSPPAAFREGAAGDPSMSAELPFIATLERDDGSPLVARPRSPGSSRSTPNAYELIVAADALPNAGENGQKCMECLRDKKAAGASGTVRCGRDSYFLPLASRSLLTLSRPLSSSCLTFSSFPSERLHAVRGGLSQVLRGALRGRRQGEARQQGPHRPGAAVPQGPRPPHPAHRPPDLVRASHAREVPEHEPPHRELEAERVGVQLLGRRGRRGVPLDSLPPRGQGGLRRDHTRGVQGGPLQVLRAADQGRNLLGYGCDAGVEPGRGRAARRRVHDAVRRAGEQAGPSDVPLERE